MTGTWRLAALELRREVRAPALLGVLLALALMLLTLGGLAFHDVPDRPAAGAGVLWTALALVASLGPARAHRGARRDGHDDVLRTLPLPRRQLYLALALAHLALVLLVGVPLAVAVVLLMDLPAAAGPLALVLAAGTLGLVLVATLLAPAAAAVRGGALVAPVLLVPLAFPVLLGGVHATAAALAGSGWATVRPDVTLMLGHALAMGGVGWLLYDVAAEA